MSVHAVVLVAAPYGGGGGFAIPDRESLVVTFRPDGTVRAFDFRDPDMDDLLAPVEEESR